MLPYKKELAALTEQMKRFNDHMDKFKELSGDIPAVLKGIVKIAETDPKAAIKILQDLLKERTKP